jgi:hypothetical protein
MERNLVPLTPVSRFDQFLGRALPEITGEEIPVHSIAQNRDLIAYISQKLALETGLDSCDIAQWISRSLKQYWAETELSQR